MDRLNAVRTVDKHAAMFLRFGAPGYLVIAAVGGERTIEHEAWLQLPLWQPGQADALGPAVDLDQLRSVGSSA
ncbi:hypothetical protein UP10_26750 [Bradyrhizobium sp. LTSPM299]|jgi:hypothetical protein|nr:hypothetical protein UP10_26750 [Bradyrhizobium sp. LTSPM299]